MLAKEHKQDSKLSHHVLRNIFLLVEPLQVYVGQNSNIHLFTPLFCS